MGQSRPIKRFVAGPIHERVISWASLVMMMFLIGFLAHLNGLG
jgi:hypothetical protein